MWAKQKNTDGFTIVELLIVIVVIGILAAITIVAYSGISQKAMTASLQSDLVNASTKIKLFQVDNSAYPGSISDCPTPVTGNLCIKASPGNNLYYQYDGSASPQAVCVTAKNSTVLYRIVQDSTPEPGGCLTNGVVGDGLVLNLDAGNQASYSGTGTNWLNLAGAGNNVTLSNGPTYDGANGGSVGFDGNNDYADFVASNLTTVATIEMWAKVGAGYGDKMFFGWNLYDVFTASGAIGYNTGASDVYGIPSATVTSLGIVNTWKQYIFEMRSDISYTNNKIYVNGVSQTLSQISAVESAGSRNFNGGNGRIATWRANANYYMPMSTGVVRVYNRSLSQSEINQNFNALRVRYGL